MESSPASQKLPSRSSGPTAAVHVKCCFCESAPAAVMVQLPSSRKRPRAEPKPYCLLHYYTTQAVRAKNVSVMDQEEVENQLSGGMQQLFAQAFTELQQEISETSARAFSAHSSDPLAVLHDLRGKPKKRPATVKKKQQHPDGGFLRSVPLPERLLQTQQRQHDLQAQQLEQIKQHSVSGNPYKRRKSSRKSIWNLAMEQPTGNSSIPTFDPNATTTTAGISCSCGSTKVTSAGNITQRNSELTKGETWGNKDRSDAFVTRYQCESCGKVWNEEE